MHFDRDIRLGREIAGMPARGGRQKHKPEIWSTGKKYRRHPGPVWTVCRKRRRCLALKQPPHQIERCVARLNHHFVRRKDRTNA